ncbi:MAG: tetratricopeptide repeat protein [Symploca sp. SIO2E9]|nr:tetratricopeptide repeat protein [Symploca sp. SIO2E9]
MSVITIREQHKSNAGFEASVSFDGRGQYSIRITEPFTASEEHLLEWYFEEWLVFPQLETLKAAQAAQSVKVYGERLFEQVFKKDFDAYSEYRQLRGKLSQIQIEIEGKTPEFQALHWEAMRDPDLPRPLAIDCVLIRKAIEAVPVSAQVLPSPVINLLVVIARPDQEDDVGYRTISRPLIEAIENSQLRVNVELLRPGTYEALERHLEEKGENFYHLIHFDTHGALLSYKQIQQGVEKNRYFYQRGYGLGDLQPYQGVKAFLSLERESKGESELVEATELAALLTGKGIPVCILNACQSGKQLRNDAEKGNEGETALEEGRGQEAEGRREYAEEDYRETSLGSRLMAAGMQMVVAMGYSVTVSAAQIMMEKVYQELFAEKDIAEALRLGRRELYNRKQRQAYFNQKIDLEDWLLPVVYCNQQVNLNLREFTPQEEEEYFASLDSQYRFVQPTYGFVGRDLEILKIEKALLRHNILLLQGMGGTGKTTLLNYLRQWWQTTNFAENVFYFGYDQKAWKLEQILFEIAKLVYDRFELSRFQALGQRAQLQKLVAKLRTGDYILILDNLESVTGQPLAIKNTLSKQKRQEIKDFLGRLLGGKIRVVLGSRSGEQWLQDTFRDNIYTLQGLDQEARSLLAERILQRLVAAKRIPEIREDENFGRLMKLLAGYPLAMEVVLANLSEQSPGEIWQGLQRADVSLDSESGDKTESIVQCVEYSHRNLSPDAQKLLLCLAPFSGFIDRSDIPNYVKELQKLEPFGDYAFEGFDGAIQEAINWGLLSDIFPGTSGGKRGGQDERLLAIQPVFPYFLRTKLNLLDEATREALREGFKNHYLYLARSYWQLMESKDAQERQWGRFFCRLEYENLYNGLQICLQKQESVDIFFCLDQYFKLSSDIQSKLKLSELVCKAQQAYPSQLRTGEIGLEILMVLDTLASCYLQTQNYQEARDYYQKVVELTQQLSGVEERQKQSAFATIYHQLGRVAQELRQLEQAQQYYQLALDIFIESEARYDCADTYHQLGNVAQELRQFEQAQQYYQQALDIKIEYEARYECAKTYHQLGRVAEELRQFEQAQQYFQLALDINIEFGARYKCARTYHNLGIVAQELRQWEQAQQYFQQALDINIEFGARYECARTYHQLGYVAQELRQWQQAQQYYQLALDINIESEARYECASTYHQLGYVAQELRQWEQAQQYFQQALDICIEFEARYECARTYHNLGIVAQELRQWEQAQQYSQLALDIKIEYGARYESASTYVALGMLAAAQENYPEAKTNLQKALEIYVEYGDEYRAAITRQALEKLSDI